MSGLRKTVLPSTMTDPDSSSARATEGPASAPAASQQRRRYSAYDTAPAPEARSFALASSICVARSTFLASSTVKLAGACVAASCAEFDGAAGGTRPSRLIRGNPKPRSRIRSGRGMKRSGGTAGLNAGCSSMKRRSPYAGDDEQRCVTALLSTAAIADVRVSPSLSLSNGSTGTGLDQSMSGGFAFREEAAEAIYCVCGWKPVAGRERLLYPATTRR
jgi:hypothetical protein